MTVMQLAKWGNSHGIRINKEILKSLDFTSLEIENQEIKFELKIENGQIILRPIKEMTKLDKLFENFNGDPKDYKVSIDWGKPRGKEVW
ncbi:MAG: AbrB/MazE/SpoVT family DNA-binding domain-containing protein [Anaerovoracaceae bacterium]|jgi:antitoxin component of MazEF toxin-antitoxin module|nr:AbrB/MazE/SpoVT family DNA-binding domain-containing protein [Anaerovoracaceae bacterium]